MDRLKIRRRIASVLRLARGDLSVVAASASGATCRQIDRLERATVERIDLSTVYLLSLFYGVSLGEALAGGQPPRLRSQLQPWPSGAPSLPDTEDAVRARVRELRQLSGLGTPALAAAASVHQAWLVRLEGGHVLVDVVRVCLIGEALGVSGAELLPAPFFGESDAGEGSAGARCA